MVSKWFGREKKEDLLRSNNITWSNELSVKQLPQCFPKLNQLEVSDVVFLPKSNQLQPASLLLMQPVWWKSFLRSEQIEMNKQKVVFVQFNKVV